MAELWNAAARIRAVTAVSEPEPPEPPPIPAWRAGIDADRRKRPRPRGNDADVLRQITVYAIAAAIGLNVVLFLEVGAAGVGPEGIQGEIVSAINGLLPGGGLRQSNQQPSTSASPPVVTSGGS
jgi:hypothetical protein